MKIRKGDAGYIRQRKKSIVIKTVLEFGIVIALLVLGIWQTGDRLNLLTVIAILGCLPASKALVELIMIVPHHSVAQDRAMEIDACSTYLTKAFDMVFTSDKKIMPVESIVILGNTICGYSSNSKVDANIVGVHLKKYLDANKFTKASVKIYDNYRTYLARVKEMNCLTEAETNDTREKETVIRQVILNLSL